MKSELSTDREIEHLYLEFRAEFLRNTAKYNLDEEQRVDIYQDAFIVLYELIKTHPDKVEKGVKNYLFGIGRNMILDRIKSEIKERKVKEDMAQNVPIEAFEMPVDQQMNPLQKKMQKGLEQLSAGCREILVLFYFRQYSIAEIQTSMNHRSENVTKSHKSRCLKKLKELVKS